MPCKIPKLFKNTYKGVKNMLWKFGIYDQNSRSKGMESSS